MRKKIIFGTVIFGFLAAVIIGVVYFNKNYIIVKEYSGNGAYKPRIIRTDATSISKKSDENIEIHLAVKCTPNLKKCKNLKRINVIVYDGANLECLSEMNDLEIIMIGYENGYCGKLETLPELPNLKELILSSGIWNERNFKLSSGNEYNFSSIETLKIYYFTSIDCDALKYFENLHTLKISKLKGDLTNEEIWKLESRGINVEIEQRRY